MDIFKRLPIELQKHIYIIYLDLWCDINEKELRRRQYKHYKFVLDEFERNFSLQYNRFNIDLKTYTSDYLDTSDVRYYDFLDFKCAKFCIERKRRKYYRRKSFHSARRNSIQNKIRYGKFDHDGKFELNTSNGRYRDYR